MNLEKAAQALVDCGYADRVGKMSDGRICIVHDAPELDDIYVEVDPIHDEAQRRALLEWYKVDLVYGRGFWEANNNQMDMGDHFGSGKTRIEAENACLSEILRL